MANRKLPNQTPDSNDKNVSEDDIATDKDVADMLNKVFG